MNHAAAVEREPHGDVVIAPPRAWACFRHMRRACVALAMIGGGLIASLLQGCVAPAHPPRPVCESCRMVCGECEGQDRFVRLQGSPPGLRQDRLQNFSHPVTLRTEDWKIILSSLRVRREGEPVLLFSLPKGPISDAFTQDEIEYLSRTLRQAFALAQPTEWVVFGLSRSREPEVSEITTGGWFMDGRDLHLVLANYRYAVTAPSIRELVWENPLSRQVNVYELVPGAHQTVTQVQEGGLLRASANELSIAYKPLLLAEPVSQSVPPDGSSSPLFRQGRSEQRSIEERLKALKQLRDQGLITEEEYRSTRSRLLEQL
jgi:putative oligomerization/nucleic acid binding protein